MEVVGYNLGLQESWFRRCRGTYDESLPKDWVDAIWEELQFWFYYLRGLPRGEAVPPEGRPLDRRLRALARRAHAGSGPPRKVRVLDIGSGPVSLIGRSWPGVEVEVVTADPLACFYRAIREDVGISAPGMTDARPVGAERLLEVFGTSAFDLVHCSNALDHSHAPMRGIVEAVRVVRAGRPVLLVHSRNEALANDYTGLHRWNFDVRDGRLVIWRPGHQRNTTNPGHPRLHRLPRGAAGKKAQEEEEEEVREEAVDVEARLLEAGLIDPGGVEIEVLGPLEPHGETHVSATIWRRVAA